MVEWLPPICGVLKSMLSMLQVLVRKLINQGDYDDTKFTVYGICLVRSRSLLSVDPKLNFHIRACDWFKQLFMREELDDFELNRSNSHLSGQPFSMLITSQYNLVTSLNFSRNQNNVTQLLQAVS